MIRVAIENAFAMMPVASMETFVTETETDKVMRLQNGLIACATGGTFDDREYRELRGFFMNRPDTKTKAPDFVRHCRDTSQFWAFIKQQCGTYKERRELIWTAFRPLIDYIEAYDRAPGIQSITETLEAFNPEHVHAAWQKALNRRTEDPEGAITAARTLIETVCKHILDDSNTTYEASADLPKLWALTAKQLNLAPDQHEESVFKTILGNCQSVVNSLGTIRNRVGDAHGQGRRPVKPKQRHAELAVNLAGTMASFLVATWKDRNGGA